ncbi:hypothetical protein ACQP2E_26565 [Actinoplanes sp. CA-015351]|uniref:hypothetical protein n=1 Tax=Actinoplanes sp. CA-015351 TaxID=3239897 RepID=UPI003D990745
MESIVPDVTLWTDGGGRVRQTHLPVAGLFGSATRFAGMTARPYKGVSHADMAMEIVELNGSPGLVIGAAVRVLVRLALT